jgi:hypothetical protein
LVDGYVANDIHFSDKTSRLAILTGPNMAGEFFILVDSLHKLIEWGKKTFQGRQV